jgi:lycopene cyclase domain-containing protein
MGVARHDTGVTADLRAFASQVHPVFMLPPIAAAWFGGILAGDFEIVPVALVSLGTFFAVYTAHVKDGYVDYHVRGEDDDHPLTVGGCKLGLAGAGLGFAASLALVWTFVDPATAVLLAPTWLIGYLHAPTLDTNPIGATMGYPTGIALVIVAGTHAQTGAIESISVAFALVFLLVLTGVKIVDDLTDVEYDASIDKHTVGVVLGESNARTLAYTLMGAGCVLVLAFAIEGVLPASAPLAIPAFAVVAAYAHRGPPDVATALLVRGAYVFLAVLVAAAYFQPLANAALPDITVLGGWTYLATEIVFGTLALALLTRAGRPAMVRAVKTIALLYPLAYVWDWYTLEVGVFAIQQRTGVELLGIPIEEHLFMLVVPALVLGIHENLHDTEDSQTDVDGGD